MPHQGKQTTCRWWRRRFRLRRSLFNWPAARTRSPWDRRPAIKASVKPGLAHLMTIVMGLDQHRAQITTEWIDTGTGEIRRVRVTPAHREGVRRFLARFAGEELEVALEATTGWRFVVE